MQSVPLPRYHPLDVFEFARARQARAEALVLIFIEAFKGASLRPVGTPMAVCANGDYAGYVSNGCVDADIAAQALEALKDTQMRRVSYGPDSPYLDIRLPCGGSVSLVVYPNPDPAVITALCDEMRARRSIGLDFSETLSIGGVNERETAALYQPPIRVVAAGRGEPLLMFARAAYGLGIDCLSLTPDAGAAAAISAQGSAAKTLEFGQPLDDVLGAAGQLPLDRYTAVVTLFHDHDYEMAVLIPALRSEAFYVGAMGSRQTHAARRETLKPQLSADQLAALRGPIGLVPSQRDAGRLAISVLAEIISVDPSPF